MESLSKVWISASKPQLWHFALCLSQPPLSQLSLGQHRALLTGLTGQVLTPSFVTVMADRKEEAGKRENEEKREEREQFCTLSWHSNMVVGLHNWQEKELALQKFVSSLPPLLRS